MLSVIQAVVRLGQVGEIRFIVFFVLVDADHPLLVAAGTAITQPEVLAVAVALTSSMTADGGV